jgi:Sigma-70, region 4
MRGQLLPRWPTSRTRADRVVERDELRRALRVLSPHQRVVLVLRYYAGLDDDAIAAHLGCGVSSVRTHASRRLARLRGAMHLVDEPADRPADGLADGLAGGILMGDLDDPLRVLFRDLAERAPHDPDLATTIQRRVRRRRAAVTIAFAGASVVAVVAVVSLVVLGLVRTDQVAPSGRSPRRLPHSRVGVRTAGHRAVTELGAERIQRSHRDVALWAERVRRPGRDRLHRPPAGGGVGAGSAEQDPLGDAHSAAGDRSAEDHRPAGEHRSADRGGSARTSGPVHRRPPDAGLRGDAAPVGAHTDTIALRYRAG